MAQNWTWQNPVPTGADIDEVFFLDSNKGWAVGENGGLFQTVDGGQTWLAKEIGYSASFEDIQFIDNDNGWIIGYGTVLHTSDGGLTWTQQQIPDPYAGLGRMSFVDENYGWAAGAFGTVIYTNDGGDTWVNRNSGINSHVNGVSFVDSLSGWVVGQFGRIWHTTNGGLNWSSQTSNTSDWFNAVHFVDDLHGWAVAAASYDGTVVHTENGGQTWQVQDTGTEHQFWELYALDENRCWAVGGSGMIIYTDDAGQTWQQQNSGTTTTLTGVFFLNESEGWVSGGEGVLLYTLNGGQTWQRQDRAVSSELLTAVSFPTESSGWVVGETGVILHTQSGGSTWQQQTSGTIVNLNNLFFVNDSEGWVCGDDGTILHTNNGGTSWNPQTSNSTEDVSGIFFLNNQTGWAVAGSFGSFGDCLITTNGGETWSRTNPRGATNSVFFISESEGWAVGDWGEIRHTTDGGENWNSQSSPVDGDLVDVTFIDSQMGWIAASYDGILHTNDGGKTWTEQTSAGQAFGIQFLNENEGWAAGGWGEVLRTNNGGDFWQVLRPAQVSLTNLFFVSNQKGWVVGHKGTILKFEGAFADAPDLSVSSDSLSFGIVVIEQSRSLSFKIRNNGSADLHIVSMTSDNSDFSVDFSAMTLFPNQESEFSVTFSPSSSGNIEGQLTIVSNDPNHPSSNITLLGKGRALPIIFVDKNATGLNTGESWANAYQSIQSAIDEARTIDDSEVWVAKATYVENLVIGGGVEVYGGFSGNGASRGERDFLTNETIIDGGANGSVVTITSGVIDGFTITNGNATSGGGIDVNPGRPVIRNNIIMGNKASVGGGIDVFGLAVSPLIERNIITGNSASSRGDAIYGPNSNAVIINNTIVNNSGAAGDGINATAFNFSVPTIINCVIWGNGDDLTGDAKATYSNIEDGDPGLGNISADPLFVDLANRDLRLQEGSPCIDSGDPRFRDPDGTRSDIGAIFYDQSHLRGRIVGSITDAASNQPVANASVLLSGIESDTTVSDQSGEFLFIPAAGSNYAVRVFAPDYAPALEENIVAQSGDTTHVSFALNRNIQPSSLFPPRNLNAQEVSNGIHLSWQIPNEELTLDDGDFEDVVGFRGAAGVVANGPYVPSSYPSKIEKIRVLFNGERAGDQFQVLVYADPSGQRSRPSASLLAGTTAPVDIAESGAFQEVDLSSLDVVLSSGQFFIGIKQLATIPMWIALDGDAADGQAFFDTDLDGSFSDLSTSNLHGVFAIRVLVGEHSSSSRSKITWNSGDNNVAKKPVNYGTKKPATDDPSLLLEKKWPTTFMFGSVSLAKTFGNTLTNYNIYRSETSPVDLKTINRIATVDDTKTEFKDTSVTVGTDYFYVLTAQYAGGESQPSNEVNILVTSVEQTKNALPNTYDLQQNYPNPFNPETTIKYQLPEASEVKLQIYNLMGQLVATLLNKQQTAGFYSVQWNGKDESGRNVASGIYLYKLGAEGFVKVRKLTLLR